MTEDIAFNQALIKRFTTEMVEYEISTESTCETDNRPVGIITGTITKLTQKVRPDANIVNDQR
jgi:hypothetical protein